MEKKYQRIIIYPKTYEKLKEIIEAKDKKMIKYLEELIDKEYENHKVEDVDYIKDKLFKEIFLEGEKYQESINEKKDKLYTEYIKNS